ncbi:MAG: hypothetical protein J6S14_00335 [Clostridia bacterium]|nr:hypothetical protein [Clostridia bacterium]
MIDAELQKTYGIAAYSKDQSNGETICLSFIKDITTDKDKLSKLVQNCNSCHLALLHLKDVIEDFLCD